MKKITLLMIMIAAIALKSFATDDKKQLTLRVMANTAADDKAFINFDFGYNTSYSAVEDAEKIQGTSPGIPIIYTLSSDQVACATNNYGEFTQNEVIGVGVNVDVDGDYTFNVEDLVNFKATTLIMLEDKVNSTLTVLNSGVYTTLITATEGETGRFFLHIKKPAQYASMNANCSNAGGKVDVAYSPDITWTSVNLLDSAGMLVQTLNDVSNIFVFNDLTGGKYSIQFNYGNVFTATEVVYLQSNAVTAMIRNAVTTVSVNQEIQFLANVSNATDFQWRVSDGTVINGVVNTYYTFPETGNYEVIFQATNDLGCTASDTAMFSVQEPTGISNVTKEEIKIWAANNRITVNIPGAVINNAWVKVYNLLGTEIYTRPVNSSITELTLSNVPNSYYIVSVENNKTKRTQKVFIGNN